MAKWHYVQRSRDEGKRRSPRRNTPPKVKDHSARHNRGMQATSSAARKAIARARAFTLDARCMRPVAYRNGAWVYHIPHYA